MCTQTGGQDDLVTIWSFKENRIIARCQGHRSWVKKNIDIITTKPKTIRNR
jgi:hypothetical protein